MVTMDLEEKTLSPEEVRKILNTDNREIVRLCKKASIIPRKNKNGQTYFSYSEVQNLKNIQSSAVSSSTAVANSTPQNVVSNLLSTLEGMEKNLTDRLSKIIDEKLDGMDEVVVELIRCKTENETLRQKINELNKENYHLKNRVKSFKAVGLGFYIQKVQDEFTL